MSASVRSNASKCIACLCSVQCELNHTVQMVPVEPCDRILCIGRTVQFWKKWLRSVCTDSVIDHYNQAHESFWRSLQFTLVKTKINDEKLLWWPSFGLRDETHEIQSCITFVFGTKKENFSQNLNPHQNEVKVLRRTGEFWWNFETLGFSLTGFPSSPNSCHHVNCLFKEKCS